MQAAHTMSQLTQASGVVAPTRRRRTPRFWVILGTAAVVAAVGAWGWTEVTSLASPLETEPLVVREDAKGDGRFGAPRSGNRQHRGIDLEAPIGTTVKAIRTGWVAEVGGDRGLGTFVVLGHPGGLQSLYGHLEQAMVKPGRWVWRGQAIATVGKSGNARHPWITPHLHLEVSRTGRPINPTTLGLVVAEPPASDQVFSTASAADADGS